MSDSGPIKSLQGKLSLGQAVKYQREYSPGLLCALSRETSRISIGLSGQDLPFDGVDTWTGYELSWLDPRGKPVVACATFSFPCRSVGMVESKSFKLYLNSFNQTSFASSDMVRQALAADLSTAVQAPVEVQLYLPREFTSFGKFGDTLPGESLDDIPASIDQYHVMASLLQLEPEGGLVTETVHSHLLKTNCPVTGQPDWASVVIRYSGSRINHASLLKYICSFRLQQEFHEQCIERMFMDLLEHCRCKELTIEARFLRRGGLDINPFRSNCGDTPALRRTVRQ